MSSHARLSPSNTRWPKCPGSVREEANYPDVSGEAAIDGTGSHLLLELCLQNGVRAESYDGQIIGANHEDNPMGWMVSLDRIERVQECLDYVQRRSNELATQFHGSTVAILPESKSNPGAHIGRDDCHGTCDITLVVSYADEIKFVETIDYKDGRGYVRVEGNTQLMLYLIGKLDMSGGIPPCRTTIVQPKTNPSVRYEDVSVGEIRARFKMLTEAAKKTDDPDAPLISGDHCTWCKHGRAKNCTAQSEQALKEVKSIMNEPKIAGFTLFDTIEETFGDVTKLDSESLEALADARAGIMAIFDRVNEEIQRRVEDPDDNTITAYAMLPGNDSNAWIGDVEAIEKMLKGRKLKKDEIFPSKLISPAAMMKLEKLTKDQKTKIWDKHVEKKPGESTLKKVRTAEKDAEAMFVGVHDACVKTAEEKGLINSNLKPISFM